MLSTREHGLGATGGTPAFVGRAVPIYFIGDSHTLIHNHLLYAKNGTHYITQSHYIHGLYARDFCPDGKISERVMAPLVGLLAPADDGWRLRWRDVTLVVQCGDLDARRAAIELGADAGLVLPFAPQERVPGPSPVPYALVEGEARRSLEPLFLGLSQLRKMGFERLAVAAIPPADARRSVATGSGTGTKRKNALRSGENVQPCSQRVRRRERGPLP